MLPCRATAGRPCFGRNVFVGLRETHLGPVVELIEGQVQLQHVTAESRDVGPVSGFADPAVTQDQRAGQEEAICKHGEH